MHGSKNDVATLRNFEVFFLPPNTTKLVQPLDTGIIAKIEGKFRKHLIMRIFENIEDGRKSIYKIDIIKAVRWDKIEWEVL